jgi:hypothetical protein
MNAGSKYLIAEQAIIDFITQNCLITAAENGTMSSQDNNVD